MLRIFYISGVQETDVVYYVLKCVCRGIVHSYKLFVTSSFSYNKSFYTQNSDFDTEITDHLIRQAHLSSC